MKRVRTLLLCFALCAPSLAHAAPNTKSSFGAPAQERKVTSGMDEGDLKRLDESARRAASAPSNELESRHYFRDRPDALGGHARAEEQRMLEELLKDREQHVIKQRDEAIRLLERFIAEEPEAAPEMADALLRL